MAYYSTAYKKKKKQRIKVPCSSLFADKSCNFSNGISDISHNTISVSSVRIWKEL